MDGAGEGHLSRFVPEMLMAWGYHKEELYHTYLENVGCFQIIPHIGLWRRRWSGVFVPAILLLEPGDLSIEVNVDGRLGKPKRPPDMERFQFSPGNESIDRLLGASQNLRRFADHQ